MICHVADGGGGRVQRGSWGEGGRTRISLGFCFEGEKRCGSGIQSASGSMGHCESGNAELNASGIEHSTVSEILTGKSILNGTASRDRRDLVLGFGVCSHSVAGCSEGLVG